MWCDCRVGVTKNLKDSQILLLCNAGDLYYSLAKCVGWCVLGHHRELEENTNDDQSSVA